MNKYYLRFNRNSYPIKYHNIIDNQLIPLSSKSIVEDIESTIQSLNKIECKSR